MSFHIYSRAAEGNCVRYVHQQPLRLGGPAGPIARHVRTFPDENSALGWELDVPALIKLAGVVTNGTDLTVLFDVSSSENNTVCLYRLQRIGGSARNRNTHLSLAFEVLIDERVPVSATQFKASFTMHASKTPRLLREILQLSGGPGGGDWKWEAPAMNLGATLVCPAPAGDDRRATNACIA